MSGKGLGVSGEGLGVSGQGLGVSGRGLGSSGQSLDVSDPGPGVSSQGLGVSGDPGVSGLGLGISGPGVCYSSQGLGGPEQGPGVSGLGPGALGTDKKLRGSVQGLALEAPSPRDEHGWSDRPRGFQGEGFTSQPPAPFLGARQGLEDDLVHPSRYLKAPASSGEGKVQKVRVSAPSWERVPSAQVRFGAYSDSRGRDGARNPTSDRFLSRFKRKRTSTQRTITNMLG